MATRVRIKRDALIELANEKGWVKQNGTVNSSAMAREIGVYLTTASRIVNGDRDTCGPAIISGLLAAAPDRTFDDLFIRDTQAA